MENNWAKNNIRLLGVIISIIIASGLSLEYNISLDFGDVHGFNSIIFALLKCLPKERLLSLLYFISTYFLTEYFLKKSNGIKSNIGLIVFSGIFTVCQYLGDGFTYQYPSGLHTAMYFVCFYKYFSLFVFIFLLSFALFKYITEYINKDATGNTKITIWKVAVLLFVTHIIYYLIFFPGLVGKDASIQALLYFGEHTGNAETFYRLSPWYGVREYTISSHHPFLTTYLFGWVFNIGYKLGNPAIGVAIYDFIQMVCTVLAETFVIYYFNKAYTIPVRVRKICVVFFAFFPPLTLSAITMNKDNIYAVIHLLLLICLIEVVRTGGEIFKKKKFVIAVFVLNCIYILTRGQGIYILFVVAIALLIKYRKFWLQIGVAFIVSILFCQFFVNGFVANKLNIAPAGKQEVLGVFFQQTARYVKKYENEVTAEEKEAISNVLDYESLVIKYNTINQDPVKFTYNQQATTEDLKNYFIVWGKMFIKHPQCYFMSVLHNIYSMYYMDRNSNYGYLSIPEDQCEQTKYQFIDSEPFNSLRDTVNYSLFIIQRTAGISYIGSIASMFWISVICIILTLKNRREYFIPLLMDILLICTFFICPVMSFRYLLPLMISIPIKIMLACYSIENQRNNTNSNTHK